MERKIVVSISNDTEGISQYQAIKAIKDAGFENVFIQWYNKDWEISQSEQLRYAKELGLKVNSAHLGYDNINSIWSEDLEGDELIDYYRKDFDACISNGISLVYMHLTKSKLVGPISEIALLRAREIVAIAKEKWIRIAFENTRRQEYNDYILSNIQDEHVGICFDIGHCHSNSDGEFNFELYKDRFFDVHLHDNDKSSDQHLLPFDGTVDWEKGIRNLRSINYQGNVTMELCYRRPYLDMDPVDFYKKGLEIGHKLVAMLEKQ